MIRIRNKKTGEVKEIEESQLGSFGLAPKVDPTATPEKVTEPSTKITVDQLYKMSLDPKIKPATYTKIKQLYDLQQEEVKNSGKGAPTTVEGQKTEGLVNSGIRALATVQSEYQRDPSLTLKQKVPGKFFSRKFDSALFNSVDTLLRLRTGATAPPSEVRNYMRSFGPVFGDSPEDVQFKLNQLQADLLDAAGRKDEFKPLTIKVAEGKKTTPLGQFGEVFAPGVTKSIDIVKNIPEATRVASEEMGQKGLLGAPSPKLRKLVGGTGEETGNRAINALSDASSLAGTEQAAVNEISSIFGLIKSGPKALRNLVGNKEPQMAESELLKGLQQAEAGKEVRQTLISKATDTGKTIDGTKTFNIIKSHLTDAKSALTETESKQVDSLIKRAEKLYKNQKISPLEAKKRWDLADTGFKNSGVAGDTVKQQFHMAIRNGLRSELDRVVPGFERETSKIANGLKLEKFLKPIRNARDRKIVRDALVENPGLLKVFFKKIGPGVVASASTLVGAKLMGAFGAGGDNSE